jgi:hypothetical protein
MRIIEHILEIGESLRFQELGVEEPEQMRIEREKSRRENNLQLAGIKYQLKLEQGELNRIEQEIFKLQNQPLDSKPSFFPSTINELVTLIVFISGLIVTISGLISAIKK